MKAKSHSRKKFSKIEQKAVNQAANYVIDWTKKELKKFITKPVVIQIGDYGFNVGKYNITGTSKRCWSVQNNDGFHIHNFLSKTNAILFCLCETTNSFIAAKELLDIDSKIGRLENDLAQYRYHLSTSKDKFKTELYLNRYLDASYQYKAHSDILKKTLKLAKYTKFGNQTL